MPFTQSSSAAVGDRSQPEDINRDAAAAEERRQGPPVAQGRGGTNPTVDQRRSVLFPDASNKVEAAPEPPPKLPDFLKKEIISDDSFKPFARNAEKQKRYEQFRLCLKHDSPEVLRVLQPRNMTEWEREKEKLEFERASMLFLPMAGVLGSRFASAGDSETVDTDGSTKLEQAVAKGGAEAAALGLFGALTREVEEWRPARLLCVRFNVANPFEKDSGSSSTKPAKKETGVTNVFAALENVQEGGEKEQKEEADTEEKQASSEEVKPEAVEEEEVIVPKPPMDLFKAIFAESESEEEKSEAEEEKEKEEDKGEETAAALAQRLRSETATASANKEDKPWEERQGNVLRSKEAAKGIFANLDFDALNKRTSTKRPRSASKSPARDSKDGVVTKVEGGSSSEDNFGPSLPPIMMTAKVTKSITLSSDSEDHIKEKKSKKRKKEKKEKKKKKHKEVLSSDSEDNMKERKGKKRKTGGREISEAKEALLNYAEDRLRVLAERAEVEKRNSTAEVIVLSDSEEDWKEKKKKKSKKHNK